MKKIYYLFILTLIFVSCKRDCTQITDSIQTVSKYDLDLLFPYNGIDKLRFLKNKTDTLVFYKKNMITSYSYTTTQDECPSKIPLEQKYLVFIDSIQGNNFTLFNYVNSAFNICFRIIINNKTISDGSTIDYIMPYPPVRSLIVLGMKYDTISRWQNHFNDSAFFKAQNGGLISFTDKGNTFELMPQ
ncbi:MAG: hypothetical protein NTU43_02445 [Bacteroidetes bacterium]|nr:hypothetical protein [Bacteroidota bacterium]